MVPTPVRITAPHSHRLLLTLLSLATQHVPRLFRNIFGYNTNDSNIAHTLLKREKFVHDTKHIVFACLIPILVLLSGMFAGLTLGYMSLDETQLNVLSISGTKKQRDYANKIKPIRKNGHLLLVTLLLGNMIVNETLPIISDPVLGGGVQSVVVSTVLIVIFAEIIPQSVFTRHGLYLGAKMATPTKYLIYFMGVIAWPVAKLLEFVLGPHHGIIYRRAELKELIAMHSHMSSHGGDLKTDTVTIIGATLDLQEKVVKQAMTPIDEVFMLSIDSKLDYDLLKNICTTGHSRVPVYEEVELPVGAMGRKNDGRGGKEQKVQKVKKIIGILLVKQCVLLDPKDAVPLRKIPLNKVPFVPNNMPLLGILDKFQEGKSHMAIVSRFSVDKAASVKKAVKRGLTQRLRERVGIGDSSDEDGEKGKKEDGEAGSTDVETLRDDGVEKDLTNATNGNPEGDANANGHGRSEKRTTVRGRGSRRRSRGKRSTGDLEMGIIAGKDHTEDKEPEKESEQVPAKDKEREKPGRLPSYAGIPMSMGMGATGLEQSMPADAVLAKEGAEEFLQSFDPAVMPLGIITLEDVLEELIGEEIYDEFDPQGAHAELSYTAATPSQQEHAQTHVPTMIVNNEPAATSEESAPMNDSTRTGGTKSLATTPVLKPIALKGLSFLRSRSAPPTPREPPASIVLSTENVGITHVAPRANLLSLTAKTTVEEDDSEKTPEFILQSSPSPTPMAASEHGDIPATGVVEGKGKSTSMGGHLRSSPTTRSSSPAPPLEAILLDRKRRLNAATSPSGSAVALPFPTGDIRRTGSPSIKGKFKSSPLVSSDRIGVVVAEKVKEGLGVGKEGERGEGDQETADLKAEEEEGTGGTEDGRILDEMEKEGPDKGW